jgi:predicted GTPase
MGPTGSGKTSFVNIASSSNLQVGQDLKPRTLDVQTSVPFALDGRKVILVDTPGFDDTNMSEVDVLRNIIDYLSTT